MSTLAWAGTSIFVLLCVYLLYRAIRPRKRYNRPLTRSQPRPYHGYDGDDWETMSRRREEKDRGN